MAPPYPRRGPNRRDRWKGKLATATSVPPACRIFCIHVLSRHMNANGIVSVPRYKLAHQANVSERRVTQFITQAKQGGWLLVVQPGYRSMTAVYQASFPDAESGNGSFSHSRAERGNDAGPLSAGTECSRIQAEKGERIVPATIGTYVPTDPTATSGKSARGHVPNDDAFEDDEQGIITSRREAPATDELVESIDLSSSFARRHLRAVGE